MIPLFTMLLATSNPPLNCKAPTDQVSISECIAADFQRADAELNRVWAKVMAWARDSDADLTSMAIDSGPKLAPTLRVAENAWLAYRDAQCTAEGLAFRGGTVQPSVVLACKTRLTKSQSYELRRLSGVE